MSNAKNDKQAKVVLVTGVSSGIGQESARYLLERGMQIFGTVRNVNATSASPGLHLVQMDVTDAESVHDAVQLVLAQAGRIDALVNNAGYVLSGALEETSIAEAQEQFDTNFFGILRVIQAVLPTMRQQQAGRIVNISSVLGFLPAPYMGIYGASKFAVEGYTETLDHEVRHFGIRALLVEPPYINTPLNTKGKHVATTLPAYAASRHQATSAMNVYLRNAPGPQLVAAAVYQAITQPQPRLRYPVGEGVLLSRLRRFAPPYFLDRGIRTRFALK
jgi:NAD(P)-dependent dehydrogenase (short-subunit alcohol dehydrogenase family)